jgi:multiple sugar transport system substrate-binding protein
MFRRTFCLSVLILVGVLVLAACGGGTAPTSAPAATSAPGGAATSTPPTGATSAPVTSTPAPGAILFHSSQFAPVNESELMRNTILKDSPVPVDFEPQATGPFADIPLAQAKANKMQIDVIGGQHGDFPAFQQAGILDDVGPLLAKLADRQFPDAYVKLGKLGTDTQYYIPWAQATYIMVANKKALQYLPQGADINALTYDQLTQWAAAVQKATGQRLLGLPMGPQGLIHRFWQGYLLPSYTGTEVVNFKSADAVKAWTDFKNLWQYVNPSSINYNTMSDPLKSGEVWIAWDHVARLADALKTSPNDYVAFPAPAGPKGRSYMPVVLGLAIPKGAPHRAQAEQLITYLTDPKTQALVASNLSFFPVVAGASQATSTPGISLESDAVAKLNAAKDAFPAMLPTGLGTKGGDWNKAYNDTFTRIVMKNEDIQTVLNAQAQVLQGILNDTKAPCWAPDPDSGGQPCQVK